MISGAFQDKQTSSAVDPESNERLHALAQRWAKSGAMWLTGLADGPALGCPAGVVEVLDSASQELTEHSKRFSQEVSIDGLALLGERAALSGLSRRGSTSCGGATRILQTGDGYLALSLARPGDLALLPALLGDSLTSPDQPASVVFPDAQANDALWALLSQAVRHHQASELSEWGAELGMAIAVLPPKFSTNRHQPLAGNDQSLTTTEQTQERLRRAVVRSPRLSSHTIRNSGNERRPVKVVDLSSLWAGPLCGQLLATAGCEVIKVESTQRPDGARFGSPEFFSLLNRQKQSLTLDLTIREDIRALSDLLSSADVVIEASRPRALEQLGIDRETILAASGVSVWLQITGHGATGNDANRIGFGDDAAVAAGLVAWDDHQPVFCADAIADPATGLVAASAVLEALGTNQQWRLDVSLRRVAEAMAWGPMLQWSGDVAPPRARTAITQPPEHKP